MRDIGAKERLSKSALELFGRKGIAGATVAEIAKRARCSQAALYKHWDGKDPLAFALFESAHVELVDGMRDAADGWEDPSRRAVGALVGFLHYARFHPEEFGLLFQVFHTDYSKWLTRVEKPSDVIMREVAQGMQSGVLPQGDIGLKSAMLLGMTIRVALFERQNLIRCDPVTTDRELAAGAAAVLGV